MRPICHGPRTKKSWEVVMVKPYSYKSEIAINKGYPKEGEYLGGTD